MLVINIHQAGSATLELQQRIWMALQGIRARYPDIQGINANAHGEREGYSLSNADHLRKVNDQFRACVAAIKE
jgi:transposase